MEAVEAVSLEANKSDRDTRNRANTVRISAARSPYESAVTAQNDVFKTDFVARLPVR